MRDSRNRHGRAALSWTLLKQAAQHRYSELLPAKEDAKHDHSPRALSNFDQT
jgi:hypothetical protein